MVHGVDEAMRYWIRKLSLSLYPRMARIVYIRRRYGQDSNTSHTNVVISLTLKLGLHTDRDFLMLKPQLTLINRRMPSSYEQQLPHQACFPPPAVPSSFLLDGSHDADSAHRLVSHVSHLLHLLTSISNINLP